VNVRILADAAAEMESARVYLDSQASGLGSRFLDELSHALAAIAERPLSFAGLETLPSDQAYRRARLKTFKYSLVFELVNDAIVVIALAHCSREPNYWLRRPR
jgi:ParE toxin of type II toxin-antitoxin system, parDE